MARGINKVILIGNLGVNPEVRYLSNGSAVATLSLATTEAWKDKNTGEKQERTEWHRVVCFNRLAEISGEYLRKGSKIYIEGSLRTRKWQDPQGQDKYTTEIVANDLQMLDSRGSTGIESPMNNSEDFYSSQPSNNQSIPQTSNAPETSKTTMYAELEDDIPF